MAGAYILPSLLRGGVERSEGWGKQEDWLLSSWLLTPPLPLPSKGRGASHTLCHSERSDKSLAVCEIVPSPSALDDSNPKREGSPSALPQLTTFKVSALKGL